MKRLTAKGCKFFKCQWKNMKECLHAIFDYWGHQKCVCLREVRTPILEDDIPWNVGVSGRNDKDSHTSENQTVLLKLTHYLVGALSSKRLTLLALLIPIHFYHHHFSTLYQLLTKLQNWTPRPSPSFMPKLNPSQINAIPSCHPKMKYVSNNSAKLVFFSFKCLWS